MREIDLIVLDRDGVLIAMVVDEDHGVLDSAKRLDDVRLLPGVSDFVRQCNAKSIPIAIASNQPGVARGQISPSRVQEIDARMRSLLGEEGAYLGASFYCFHHPEGVLREFAVRCKCRKPAPGLLLQAMSFYRARPSSSWMIGDGFTDVQAGQAAGCSTGLLANPKLDLLSLLASRGIVPDVISTAFAELGNRVFSR